MAVAPTAAPDAKEASAIDDLIDVQPVPEAVESDEDDYLTLIMPRRRPYEEGFEDDRVNMDFGEGSRHSADHARTNIKFNATSPEGPGMARVPRDHIALTALLRRYPDVQIVEPETKRTFTCEVCGKEYRKRETLLTHKRTHTE